MKTQDYQINSDYEVRVGDQDYKKLLAGSFVKPIEYNNLPKHIKDVTPKHSIVLKNFSYCYTIYGIVLIPDKLIQKV